MLHRMQFHHRTILSFAMSEDRLGRQACGLSLCLAFHRLAEAFQPLSQGPLHNELAKEAPYNTASDTCRHDSGIKGT